jgi:hypothetical protein
MLEKFEKIWNTARIVVLGIVLSLFVAKAFCFAPILDVKLPSRQQSELEHKNRQRDNKKAWDKHQQNLKDAESNGDGDSKKEFDSVDIDHSQIVDYERDNCG